MHLYGAFVGIGISSNSRIFYLFIFRPLLKSIVPKLSESIIFFVFIFGITLVTYFFNHMRSFDFLFTKALMLGVLNISCLSFLHFSHFLFLFCFRNVKVRMKIVIIGA